MWEMCSPAEVRSLVSTSCQCSHRSPSLAEHHPDGPVSIKYPVTVKIKYPKQTVQKTYTGSTKTCCNKGCRSGLLWNSFFIYFFKEYLCKVTFYHRNLSWQDKDTLENIPNSMLRSVVLPQEEQNATLYYLTVLTEVQQSAFKPLIGVLWKLSQKLVLSRAQHHSLQPTYTLTCLKPAQKQSCKRAQDLSGR